MCAPRHRAKNDHLTDTVHAQKQLREQSVECGPTLLDAAIRDGVSRSLRRRHSCQAEFAQIAGKCGLGDIPPALEQKLAQVFLAADDAGIDYLEDRVVSFALVGHESRV